MEVRFSNLSISADLVVADEKSGTPELPTLLNTIKKTFKGVSKSNKQSVRKEILKNISSSFKPGTITLLLGQPSSGKSSLMKILSGRLPMEKNITVEGNIHYNGQNQKELIKRLPQFAAYTTQRDKHYPVLSVKETLEFAHACSGGELTKRGEELLSKGTPEENLAALEATKAMFAHYPDVVIQQLGLENCMNTIVGDTMTRGVSGGERKRVRTGEMEFGMKYMTFMDEISTGLDSAATFDIVNTQRSIAKKLRKTVVIALLQPAPEVFALFDDVMIMNDGEVMYHGPCDQVIDYFQGLGFTYTPERDVADYLLDLGTKQQRRYETPSAQNVPRYPSEFAKNFRRSAIHHEMLRTLEGPYNPELLENVAVHMDHMPEFHQSFWESTVLLGKRQLVVQFRNKAFIFGRIVVVLVMGLLNATTFYQFDAINMQVVMGIIFTSIMFLSLGQASQIPTYLSARDIFYKQRGANFFRTTSYVLANSLSQIPLATAETIIFGSLVYWMCGFVSKAAEFILFEVILLTTNVAFGAWFFFTAAAAKNGDTANPISMVSVLCFMIFAGFIIVKPQIPDYFIWIHWINPVSWALRALAVNQYRSDEFNKCVYKDVDYCADYDKMMGEYYLDLYDIPTEKSWVVYGILYSAVLYLLFIAISCFVLEYVRYETPENVSFSTDHEDRDVYATLETPRHFEASVESDTSSSAVILEVKANEVNFTPVTLAFTDLWYTVPSPSNPKELIDLLEGVTGYALPGTITALMGSSGAGKTTLMDVIAGRKTGGKISGKILLNGYEANDLAIRRCTGYCEQMGIHSEASTIREALIFSAFLRQDSGVPNVKKYDSVNECLDLLGMHEIADQIIRGSSVEQMKRLTIGVELVAQPTHECLNARSAKLIMDGVRKVANTGRTVVCTIHQPSSEVFFLFDQLLLLKRGGETVYFGGLGNKSRHLVDYFQAIPGVTPLPRGYNPATWMLECIGAGVGNATADDIDFVKYFDSSENKEKLDAVIARDGVGHPSSNLPEIVFTEKRAASSSVQMTFVVKRFIDMYWRTPTYNLTRFVISLILSLLFGLIFVDADYASYQGINSGAGMLFISSLFSGMTSFTSVLPIASQDRAAFYRERASQTYNALWYFLGSTVAEIPYVFGSALLFTVIFFPMVGFTGFETAVIFWLNLSMLMLMLTYMGQMFAYALPTEEVANIIGTLFITVFMAYMGFSPPADSIPQGYKWLYTITPLRFTLAPIVALVFCDCPELPTWNESLGAYENIRSEVGCQPLANVPVAYGHMTVKEFVESVFKMKHDDIWSNFAVVVGYTVLFRVLALLALRFTNHQKR
uniref:ABC transporter domain-containing protein n=1 Tax=Globisporangium ultimum (strain ATCC 200006 / CBS 805.95 / DAOM BR144) TaxID=431595 RepID=K3W805_GLOUD